MNDKILIPVFGCALLMSCSPGLGTSANTIPEGILVNSNSANDQLDEYRPENVRSIFSPISKVGDAPPFLRWKVIGYVDIGADTKMSNAEASERLGSRIHK